MTEGTEAAPVPPATVAAESPRPPRRVLRKGHVLLIGLSLVLSSVLALLLAEWWAAVPFLAVIAAAASWGIGPRFHDLVAPLVGFLLGLAVWGIELFRLPAGPLARLAVILGQVEGLSATAIEALTLLLFGIVVALGAATLLGLARLLEAWRSPSGPA